MPLRRRSAIGSVIADTATSSRLEADLAPVYRNLEKLEKLGVVRRFQAGHGPGRYVLAGGREREYLVCDGCHFPMVGLCADCREVER